MSQLWNLLLAHFSACHARKKLVEVAATNTFATLLQFNKCNFYMEYGYKVSITNYIERTT